MSDAMSDVFVPRVIELYVLVFHVAGRESGSGGGRRRCRMFRVRVTDNATEFLEVFETRDLCGLEEVESWMLQLHCLNRSWRKRAELHCTLI